jgi:hypothetical protein
MSTIEELLARVERIENEFYKHGWWQKSQPDNPVPQRVFAEDANFADVSFGTCKPDFSFNCKCGNRHTVADGSVRIPVPLIYPSHARMSCPDYGLPLLIEFDVDSEKKG